MYSNHFCTSMFSLITLTSLTISLWTRGAFVSAQTCSGFGVGGYCVTLDANGLNADCHRNNGFLAVVTGDPYPGCGTNSNVSTTVSYFPSRLTLWRVQLHAALSWVAITTMGIVCRRTLIVITTIGSVVTIV